MTARVGLAFPALILGSAALAFGPWLVRLADVGPAASAFWRLGLAAPMLLAAAVLAGARFPAGGVRGWLPLMLAGGCFAADLALWHAGILRTTLANATLFGNAASFGFALYGFVVARAWPGWRIGSALVAAGVGLALLLGSSAELSPRNLAGDLLCLGAAGFYTGYLILMERARARVAVLPALALATAAGAVALWPAALAEGRVWPGDWGPVVALAVGSQLVGQGLVIFAVGRLPPVVTGLGLLIQPVIAATIGWVEFGEVLTAAEWAGAALVLGALLGVRRPRRVVPVNASQALLSRNLEKG